MRKRVIAREFLSIRPQADLVQQALAADGAIACSSSNLIPFSVNADRAPQLKASVIPLAYNVGKLITLAGDYSPVVGDLAALDVCQDFSDGVVVLATASHEAWKQEATGTISYLPTSRRTEGPSGQKPTMLA